MMSEVKADDTWLGQFALCVGMPVSGCASNKMGVGLVVSVTSCGEYVQLQPQAEKWVGRLWWRKSVQFKRPFWCRAADSRLLARTKSFVEHWYSADMQKYREGE